MVKRLVESALRLPFIVFALALGLIGTGLWAFHVLDIEAYPNPVPPLVEVITQPDGWSAEEVERSVTIPLEVELSGMRGVDHIRSQSLFGLSDIKCYFKWGTDYESARQEVINRLHFVQLPNGLEPQLSPWNAIGEVFRYVVRGEGYSLSELKAAQDWILERQFRQVPGVIDVTGFGGETREYHVEVDPVRLQAYGTSLAQLTDALANANLNVGGQRVTLGEQSFTVRGTGLIGSLDDIEQIVVREQGGVPVRVRDLAEVRIGAAPRLGQIGKDQEPDVVQGIVLMRYGAETAPTLEGIYQRIDEIRKYKLLPPGMDIEPYYDRGRLVALTTRTVMENLLVGMGLVSLVLLLFLGHVRASLVTALNIPLALLAAFIGMVVTGTPANLISLGAVDFGIVIDSTVIMMENIVRRLGHGSGTARERIRAAASEVGGPMSFSTAIIAVAFLPLVTMTGVSGVIFSPMAHTYAFAIGGAILLALTLTPALSSKVLKPGLEEKESFVMRGLRRVYDPLVEVALRHPKLAVAGSVLPIVAFALLFPLLGGQFMPKLEEGNFWIRATMPSSISLEEATRHVGRMRDILRRHPEVETVVSQVGRPDDGTDVSGFNNVELFAPLKPFEEWPAGLTKAKLTEQLAAEFDAAFPGVVFGFSQAIADNVEESISGVKGENSVKVIGADIRGNHEVASSIVASMSRVRGVADLGIFGSLGQPSVRIAPDRRLCARYGLNTGDVEAVVQAAVGGQVVTQVYEGERHFDLTVRWLPQFRRDVEAIRRISVATPEGPQIPLAQIAAVTEEDGVSVVYREDGRRYTPVKFSVRGRDLASTIKEAEASIDSAVKLPYGTHLEWVGEINELKEAMGRLKVMIPLTLLAIGFLVYFAVKNWIDTLIVAFSIPIACTGGVVALLLAGLDFSVAAAMGFVSIFGIAIQDAILVVTYAQREWAEGRSLEEGARRAADQRFRPVLMTTLVATLGLLPAALSNGIGAQSQKPLAVVVIGGSLFLAGLIRVLQPPMLVMVHRWFDRPGPRRPVRGGAENVA